MNPAPHEPAPFVPIEELETVAPRAIREALPVGGWRLELLWQLDLPVRMVSVRELEWLLDLPVWQAYGRHFAVSPRDVMATPDVLSCQHARTLLADLTYPIHLCLWQGRTVILDGFHRLLKAVLIGRDGLPAMELSATDLISISRLPATTDNSPEPLMQSKTPTDI